MRRSIVVVFAAFVAASCSAAGTGILGPSATATATVAPTPSPSAPRYTIDQSSSSLILRISTTGGFISPSADLEHVPEFDLYGDGLVVVPGPQPEMSPSPVVPNVLVSHVSPAEIQRILAAADHAGLLAPDATYTSVGRPDTGTTVFTVKVAGRTHLIGASGLGPDPATGPDAGVRDALEEFRTSVESLRDLLGRTVDQAAYYAPGFRIFVSPAGSVDPTAPSGSLLDWPLTADPASASPTAAGDATCLAVIGDDTAKFLRAAAAASTQTVWHAASGNYSIQVRPMLPDEKGC